MLRNLINSIAFWAGSKSAVVLAFLSIGAYLIGGFLLGFTESFQLWSNTFMSAVSYLMLFVLQYSQSVGEAATQLKLDELIHSSKANNELIHIERLSEKELQELSDRYSRLAQKYKSEICNKSD